MSWSPFVLFSSIGSVLWVVGGIGFGVVLADEIPAILGHIGELGWGIGVALFLLILGFVAHRRCVRNDLATRH